MKQWYSAPSPETAPANDLEYLKTLHKYKSENIVVANAATKSFSAHTWYLCEELVGLAFFDKTVSNETKKQMVTALQKRGSENPLRRIKIPDTQIRKMVLSDFVTDNTLRLFAALEIETEFLRTKPNTWHENVQFLNGLQKVKGMKVVNDAAERGVALISEFNGVLTNQEDQQNYLLQVVEEHRKKFPNAKKSTVVTNLNQ